MENTKTCNQCDEIKDKLEFSGRSSKCKYCTNQNSIKKREEKAISEGKVFKYKPRLEYDPNKSSKICAKCEIEKDLSDFYTNNKAKDGKCARCISCMSRKKEVSYEDTISKVCNTCNIRKDLSEFYKGDCKLGVRNRCKECEKPLKKNYNDNRILSEDEKLKMKEYHSIYREENKDTINEKSRKYRENNKELLNKRNKEYYRNNKEKYKLYGISYRKNNKDSILNRNKEYVKARFECDILFRIKENIRISIGNSFRNLGYTKNSKTQEILGCSFEEFKLYLESKFESWMTWENRGLYNGELYYGWDIDHIIPLSSATTEEELIELNHYTNLQPLCSYINRNIKRDKIDYMKNPT